MPKTSDGARVATIHDMCMAAAWDAAVGIAQTVMATVLSVILCMMTKTPFIVILSSYHMSEVPHFCDPSQQPRPYHSRSAYVPPGSSVLLARRVFQLRDDHISFEELLRQENVAEQIARKAKRKVDQVYAQRIKNYDWPAHARIAAAVLEEERLRTLPARRQSLLRALLEHALRLRVEAAAHKARAFSADTPAPDEYLHSYYLLLLAMFKRKNEQ